MTVILDSGAVITRVNAADVAAEQLCFPVAGEAIGDTLLGHDDLHFNRVWISYRRHMLFIQRAVRDATVDPETSGTGGRPGG